MSKKVTYFAKKNQSWNYVIVLQHRANGEVENIYVREFWEPLTDIENDYTYRANVGKTDIKSIGRMSSLLSWFADDSFESIPKRPSLDFILKSDLSCPNSHHGMIANLSFDSDGNLTIGDSFIYEKVLSVISNLDIVIE